MQPPAFQLKADPQAPIQRQTPTNGGQTGMTQQELELTGQFDPATHPDFVKVEGTHLLRREVAVAWNQMQQAAAQAGHSMRLVSSTRNFDRQKAIWNDKWGRSDFAGHAAGPDRARAIMEYSSMPGTSRHHWGTDIDINSVNTSDWRDAQGSQRAGQYNALYQWMLANAGTYGFCQTYDQLGAAAPQRVTGYHEERWHWSYIPLAAGFQASYVANITNEEVAGLSFNGASSAVGLDVVNNYVNSVAANSTNPAGLGRPTVQGTVTITANSVTLRENPNRSSGSLGTLATGTTKNYYQENTDSAGNIWVLLEEGWIARHFGGRDLATVAPAAAPNNGGTTQPSGQ